MVFVEPDTTLMLRFDKSAFRKWFTDVNVFTDQMLEIRGHLANRVPCLEQELTELPHCKVFRFASERTTIPRTQEPFPPLPTAECLLLKDMFKHQDYIQ